MGAVRVSSGGATYSLIIHKKEFDLSKVTKELLIAAKQQIEKRGWTRQRFYDPDTGKVCMVGALQAVEYGHPDIKPGFFASQKFEGAKQLLKDCLTLPTKERGGDSFRSITYFNDVIAHDVDDVLEVYSCAIERCNEY